MNVGPASFDANFAQHVDRLRAHDLVFFVGQRQGRGHCDAVACVHAHRVDVFNGANDDGVVGLVTHDLHLEFFPTQKRLVHEDLGHRGGFHAGPAVEFVFFAVIRHAAASATKRKRRADDRGQANIFDCVNGDLDTCIIIEFSVVHFGRCYDCCLWVFDTKTVHGVAEQFAVFSHLDGFAFCAN